MNHETTLKQPFFAKLLESQNVTQQEQAQNAHPMITLKFYDDIEHTQKYPSDSDEV